MAHDYGVEVIDPREVTGPKTTAWFPHSLYLAHYKEDRIHYWNIQTAKVVLERPSAIFAGVREFNEGGWCYVGRPQYWYTRPEKPVPFPDDLVYSVYLNAGMYVYHWRADEADEVETLYPKDWRNRFRSQIWPSTS